MEHFRVETDYISNQGLTARRRVHVGGKSFETPTAAIPIGRAAHQDTPNDASRGVCELYKQVSTKDLTQSMREESSSIADALAQDYRKTNEEEVTIAFSSYQDGHQIGRREVAHLVDQFGRVSDILPVPLMPELVGNIDTERGVSAPSFQSYRSSIEQFIDTARKRTPNSPIMGVIPPLGWEYVENLLELYGRKDIRAFCLNLNRRRITAGRQVGMVTPLMQHLARRGITESVMTYLINPNPYGRGLADDLRPAADVAAFGMGIDVIGDCHVSPGGFTSDAGSDDAAGGVPPTFRLLNRATYSYEDVALEDLKERLPSDTGFDPDRVVSRTRNSPENGKYQMQKLVNMEQIALAGRELQERSREDIFTHLTTKAGVTQDTQAAFEEVRKGFNDGSSQTGLSDF